MIGGLQAPSECCSMLPILGDGGAANTFGPDTRPAVAISQAAHTLIVVFLWPSGGALAADRAPIGSLVNTVLYPPTVERSPDASHQDQPAQPAFRPHCRDLCCPGDRRPRGVPAHPQSTDRRSSAVSCIARGGEL